MKSASKNLLLHSAPAYNAAYFTEALLLNMFESFTVFIGAIFQLLPLTKPDFFISATLTAERHKEKGTVIAQ